MSEIPRYTLGFGFFGPPEQCKDGPLMKAEEVEVVIADKDFTILSLTARAESAEELLSLSRAESHELRERVSRLDSEIEGRIEANDTLSSEFLQAKAKLREYAALHFIAALVTSLSLLTAGFASYTTHRYSQTLQHVHTVLEETRQNILLQEKNYGL
jgi:hypothetical protein